MKRTVVFLFDFLIIMCLVVAFTSTGCIPTDPDTTRIIGADGRVLYEPPGQVAYIQTLPSTGLENLDYAIGTLVATIYAGLGIWIRKVKVNNDTVAKDFDKRLTAVELHEGK